MHRILDRGPDDLCAGVLRKNYSELAIVTTSGWLQRIVRRVAAAKKVVDHVVKPAYRVRDWLRRFQLMPS